MVVARLVYSNGCCPLLVADSYCYPDMASIGKAFTSISCGIMLKEKQDQIPEGLETRVFTEKYLPQAFPLDDPAKAEIKLGQLLSMSSGLTGKAATPEMVATEPTRSSIRFPARQDQWTRIWSLCGLLCRPAKPGGGYSYASSSPHIASIVLRNLTGMEMQQ